MLINAALAPGGDSDCGPARLVRTNCGRPRRCVEGSSDSNSERALVGCRSRIFASSRAASRVEHNALCEVRCGIANAHLEPNRGAESAWLSRLLSPRRVAISSTDEFSSILA